MACRRSWVRAPLAPLLRNPSLGAHEYRKQLGWYMERAAAGESFLITRRGKPYARLSPTQPPSTVPRSAHVARYVRPDRLPHVDGVRHRFIGANGITFHVAEAGAGDDVVLLLHGWPQHWYEWRELIGPLAERHRVIALDLRGFGWTDAPATRLREGAARHRRARRPRRARDRPREADRPRLGRLDRLPALPPRPGAVRPLPRSRRRPPLADAGGGWRDLPRFWYHQLVIAAPGLGYALHRSGAFVRLVLRARHRRPGRDRPTAPRGLRRQPRRARPRPRVRPHVPHLPHPRAVPADPRPLRSAPACTCPPTSCSARRDPVLTERLVAGYEAARGPDDRRDRRRLRPLHRRRAA